VHDSLANSQPNFQAMKKTSQSVSETEFAVWILIAMLLVLILVFGYLIDKHISSEFSQSFRVEDTLGLCAGAFGLPGRTGHSNATRRQRAHRPGN